MKKIFGSMLTVVDFTAKQARYMITDKFLANYFFIELDFKNLAQLKKHKVLQK